MFKRWSAWTRGTRCLAVGIGAVVLALAITWVLFVPTADGSRTTTSAQLRDHCSRRHETLREADC